MPPEEGTLGKRISIAERQKIPYILVLGDKEIEANSVNVRSRIRPPKSGGRRRETSKQTDQKLDGFVKKIVKEVAERML